MIGEDFDYPVITDSFPPVCTVLYVRVQALPKGGLVGGGALWALVLTECQVEACRDADRSLFHVPPFLGLNLIGLLSLRQYLLIQYLTLYSSTGYLTKYF